MDENNKSLMFFLLTIGVCVGMAVLHAAFFATEFNDRYVSSTQAESVKRQLATRADENER